MPSQISPMANVTQGFVTLWRDPLLAEEIAQKLSCDEVEALAAVLASYNEGLAAALWLQAHSLGDDIGDAHFGLPTPSLSWPESGKIGTHPVARQAFG